MTNTLHRYGDAESFRDDYIVFATPSSDRNDADSVPKLKRFLEMALPFKPVNIGDPVHGGTLRPARNLHTVSNWKRDMTPNFRAVIDGIDTPDPNSVVMRFKQPYGPLLQRLDVVEAGYKFDGTATVFETTTEILKVRQDDGTLLAMPLSMAQSFS